MQEARKCFRDPIPEIFRAAEMLDKAVDAHLSSKNNIASDLILQSDIPAISEWTESIWGKYGPYNQVYFEDTTKPTIPKELRVKKRMPNKEEEQKIINRDGYHCVFCGIPVIRPQIRNYLRKCYPEVLRWGDRNIDQHAAFQAMWLQFDHVVPHSRGGNNDVANIVITCAPCNFGRMDSLVQEVGLIHPNKRERINSKWDGLERVML